MGKHEATGVNGRKPVAMALTIGIALTCAASADDFITAQDLRQTIAHLPADFEPLQIVEIAWSSIPAYKGHQPVDVAIVHTPDRSVETFALRSNGAVW